MKKLRLLAATEEPHQSSVNGQATIHAPQGVTVVLTVPVHGARLARTVAIQWHHTREGLQKTGTPPADGADGVTTVTYNFAADRPGTFIYHARYRRDRATALVDVRGSEAEPSAGGRARTHAAGLSAGRRAPTASRHGAVDVRRRDDGSAGGGGGSSARTAVARRHGDGLALPRWGMVRVSVEAQLMGDFPVIYYDAAEYGGGAPVLGLLRRSAAALLAAAALWVSSICDPDTHLPRRGGSQPPATLS